MVGLEELRGLFQLKQVGNHRIPWLFVISNGSWMPANALCVTKDGCAQPFVALKQVSEQVNSLLRNLPNISLWNTIRQSLFGWCTGWEANCLVFKPITCVTETSSTSLSHYLHTVKLRQVKWFVKAKPQTNPNLWHSFSLTMHLGARSFTLLARYGLGKK